MLSADARAEPGLAVVDIDGVVADVRHRLHHLDPPKSWRAFFAEAPRDPLLPQGAALVADLAQRHRVVWLTGRPEYLRQVTQCWLADHDLPAGDLQMRPNGDRRPARVFKLGRLRRMPEQAIALFVDDDPDVVAAARARGIATMLADWVPRNPRLSAAQEIHGRT
jgi:uncharacterized HAD superfamily protein